MIVLDTNVVSELLLPDPNPRVVGWLDQQNGDDVYLTVTTAAELRAGVAIMPSGRRKTKLNDDVETLLSGTFADRVLSFTVSCTDLYASVHRARRNMGRPVENADAEIAAMALEQQAILATRNIRDFDEIGLELVNPWEIS